MTSKSPVRSCEDVDETALSYAEIKALCAGNPLIAEKMNLDVEVTKLRMIKSDFQSQKHRLEDDLIQRFPRQITALNERIEGVKKDISHYNEQNAKSTNIQEGMGGSVSTTAVFHGMEIKGISYSEKEPAGKALLEACKTITAGEEMKIGNYMGFDMALRIENFGRSFVLSLRGNMTYNIELGTDAFGNITRINNSLNDLPKRLEESKLRLESIIEQQEAAKVELAKPFALADELTEKEARLAKINSELNIGDESTKIQVSQEKEANNDSEYDSNYPTTAVQNESIGKPSFLSNVPKSINERHTEVSHRVVDDVAI